jgi:hypothetical protein
MADDFSESLKKILASRVGNLCSNPECRASTSAPQANPAKALNIGVAAHITAASPGGPRYDPELLPKERSGPSNGLWLCQNCAKLIDNDPTRFPTALLKSWKEAAEIDAHNRLGNARIAIVTPSLDLKAHDRVRIGPIVPRRFEQDEWTLTSNPSECLLFQKLSTPAHIEIPPSFIEMVHRFGGSTPVLVQLVGRLQWISVGQQWQLLSEKPQTGPQSEHGFSKYVDFDYPRRMGYAGGFAWRREDRLAQCLSQDRHIFYAEDGKYLRVHGPDTDQILVSNRP